MINFTYSDKPNKDGVYLVLMAEMENYGEYSKPFYKVLEFEGLWNIKAIIQVYAWAELPEIKISPTP